MLDFGYLNDSQGVPISGPRAESLRLAYSIACQLYNHSWVSIEGTGSVIQTTEGSAAGMPLADLFYSIAMSRVLARIRGEMREIPGNADERLTTMVLRGNKHILHEVSYYDDSAFPVCSPAISILSDLAQVAQVVHSVYTKFFLQVNMSKNKTEAIVAFYGPGANQTRRKLATEDNNTIAIPTKSGEVLLRVVQTYKHLGTTMSAVSSNVSQEVAIRSAIMSSQSKKLRKILSHPDIPIHKKVYTCQAYVLSKGAHHCGTWPALTAHQLQSFSKPILMMYRVIVGESFVDKEGPLLHSDDIIRENGFLAPQNIIRRLRLSLFTRLCQKQVSTLLDLVFDTQGHKKGWSKAVFSDLVTLANLSIHPALDPGKHFSSLAEWSVFFSTFSKRRLRQVVATACGHPLLQEMDNRDSGNVGFGVAGGHDLGGTGCRPLACDRCGRLFLSPQARAAHCSRAHGVKSIWRRYVGAEVHCIVCMRMFWTRERLVNHIRYRSEICRHQLAIHPPPMSEAEADELDRMDLLENRSLHHCGSRRHKAAKPCVQLFGPLLPITARPGAGSSSHHPLGVGQQYYRY